MKLNVDSDEKKLNAVAELLTESWRLNRFTKNLTRFADEKLTRKIDNQVARFDKKFFRAASELDLEVLDFTGAEFETGLPIEPINLSDFAAEENLFVEAMLEPAIKRKDSAEIVKLGVAVLGRRNA